MSGIHGPTEPAMLVVSFAQANEKDVPFRPCGNLEILLRPMGNLRSISLSLSTFRSRRAAALLLAAALASTGASGVSNTSTPPMGAVLEQALQGGHGLVSVIVQTIGDARPAARLVQRYGGAITQDLPIVNGFAATGSADSFRELARLSGVRAITLDRPVVPFALPAGGSEPTSVYPVVVGADRMWATGARGNGVTVAIIDTGIANVPDLAGRIVPVTVDEATGATALCVNFSGEAGCQDSYGHGTFVAGVVAGSGASSGGAYKGIAPEARVLSVKLSGRDGAADVSGLLASLQWVVSHKDRYGIRVLNLSIGSDSPQSYRIDPLNYAVERVWDAGIVVVAAASNRGPNPATITKPGDDPWVITVGAIDDVGTVGTADDLLPSFTGRGPTLADALIKPDLVAPGAHVTSLEAPGSAIAELFPSTVGSGYRRGSGTSFAAPAVAGAAALLIGANPALTPDRIKYMLTSTARPGVSVLETEVGKGTLDVWAASSAGPGTANAGLALSTGMGSLDLSRGTLFVQTTDVLPVLITGDQTGQLQQFNQNEFVSTEWTGASWHGSQWAGASWHGASWHGASWHGASWHGASWHGASWHGADGSEPDYGTGWLGSAIYGAWE